MKCIFCLEEKPPSDEHVIPESIGGRLRIKEVCRECNSELSRLVDNPFASCSIVRLARYSHSMGGKRDIVPFPFRGIGTLETGQRVSLDDNFTPHVKREFAISKLPDGGLKVQFSADASDKDSFEQMLGEPLRKAFRSEFPDWSLEKLDEEVVKIVAHARAQSPVSGIQEIKMQWSIGFDDLLFEFLKIAYEIWFRLFGYPWVETSRTASMLRMAILNRDPGLPIRARLACPDKPLPVSDPLNNHLILESGGVCFIRLFNLCGEVECERTDSNFMLGNDESRIMIQDFNRGSIIESQLQEFLAEYLPRT